jgi:AhpD family alkylhydroperoxidase
MRVSPRHPSEYPWYLRPFFWNQRRKYGAVLDAALLWGRCPRLFLAVAATYGALTRRRSPIAPSLRAIISVRVAQLNDCPFCVDLNAAMVLRLGVEEEKLAAVESWRETNLFDDRERSALDYAEAILRDGLTVTDDHFVRLRSHFDDDAVVELTGLIAFQTMSSKFNAALGVSAQGFWTLAGEPTLRSEEKPEHGTTSLLRLW